VKTPLGNFQVPAGLAGAPVLIMLRPQGIGVTHASSGTEGYVLESRFEGDDARCSVMFQGLDDPVMARIPARKAPPKGATALFDVDPEHVLIFPREPGDAM
jgi:hypothetical protein